MADTLKLEIVTPEETVYSEDVEMVTLPGVVGQMGVYPHTRPADDANGAGRNHRAQERPRSVHRERRRTHRSHRRSRRVLTDLAVAADRIDEAKAEEARRRAEARLREKLSDEEVASVNASLARSLAQLHVKRRQRK